LERRGMVPNVASFLGHSSLRTWVLGEEATRRAASDTEIVHMRAVLVEALRASAGGFATSTAEQHNGENGVPMPSRLADCFLDLGLADDLDTLFDVRLFNTDEARVSELLRHPDVAIALSGAGAHLSFLCDAGFGLHLFGHWARERGDLTLEQAVQSVTSRVANAYRIPDRGRLTAGAWADLILFDPATVGRGARRRVNDLPTGASRLDTPAVGLHGTWVNGVRTVDERGALIRDCGRPGRLLREFAA